jgi:hypothetical protein
LRKIDLVLVAVSLIWIIYWVIRICILNKSCSKQLLFIFKDKTYKLKSKKSYFELLNVDDSSICVFNIYELKNFLDVLKGENDNTNVVKLFGVSTFDDAYEYLVRI